MPVSPFSNYTHWLLDALPRLGVLRELPPATRILVPASLLPAGRESLAMLGVLNQLRFTSEHHLELERYWFSPPPTSMLTGYNPYAVEFYCALRCCRSVTRTMSGPGSSSSPVPVECQPEERSGDPRLLHRHKLGLGRAGAPDLRTADQAVRGSRGNLRHQRQRPDDGGVLPARLPAGASGARLRPRRLARLDFAGGEGQLPFPGVPTNYERTIELDLPRLKELFRRLGQAP